MPVQPASMGYAAQLGMGATSTISEAYEFISETLTTNTEHLDTDGIIGTRSQRSETVVEGKIKIAGTIKLRPKAAELANLWQRILGGTPTGTAPVTYPVAEVVPYFWIMIDKVGKVFQYNECKINKATFTFEEGKIVELDLEIVATSCTITAAGTFTAGLTLTAAQPFVWYNATYTFNAIARSVKKATVVIDNQLLQDEYRNSQTVQVIQEGKRIVTIESTTPFTSDETDLLSLAVAGVPATVVATAGATTLTMTFAAVAAPQHDPNVAGISQEITKDTTFTARSLGAAKEIVVTQ